MKRSSAPITVQVGHREFVKVNATKYDWRDIYHLILTLSWPQFAGLAPGIYVLINLCFATLYVPGGRCIAELASGIVSRHLLLQRRNVGHRRLWARLPGHSLWPLRHHA
jgi:hypothetical protein